MTIGTRLVEGGECHLSWISRNEPASGWKLRLLAKDSALRAKENAGRGNISEVEKKLIFTRGSRFARVTRRVNITSTPKRVRRW